MSHTGNGYRHGMSPTERLEHYRSKRNFSSTSEPDGATSSSPPSDETRFVIQHHLASSEHYDLRLEHDGVLLSWAVPKGPSTDPAERRLAIRTEDHPLSYADFEGTIPADEYGGGRVIVWERGTWTNSTHDDDGRVDVDDAVRRGHLSFEVHGHKLCGGFTLQRLDDDGQWLLIKHRDRGADARRKPTSTEPESVISGHTADEIGDPEAPS